MVITQQNAKMHSFVIFLHYVLKVKIDFILIYSYALLTCTKLRVIEYQVVKILLCGIIILYVTLQRLIVACY